MTGIAIAALLYASIGLGFVLANWRAAVYLWAGCVAVVLVQHVTWTDDPRLSGIDDLQPGFALPLTPLVAVLPLFGLRLQRLLVRRYAR